MRELQWEASQSQSCTLLSTLIVCIYNTDKVKLVGDKVTIVEWFFHWFGKIMKMINDDSDEDVDLHLDNLSLPSDAQQTQSVTAG